MSIRVRFAPSPTGHLHIGSLRTALFNWLYARHNKGVFLVRVEDTDLERSKQEYTDSILASLKWFDIEPDEPVVFQTKRIEEHKQILQKLLEKGKVYKCFCTQEEVVARHEQKYGNDAFVKYDGYCRMNQTDQGKSFVIRFKLPDFDEISFDDLIRDTVTFSQDQFDDFIIARSDGSPMYNFVVVADDAAMRITHVVRGEDHISNTPKQIMLYQACGYEVPQFAHLPLILGPSGDRLSKRDAATSVMEYRAMGYLPDALLNYLVRLGWAHGDQEIFTPQELIEFFSLEHVGKKGSIFDIDKLSWINGVYIRQKAAADLWRRIITDVMPEVEKELNAFDDQQVYDLINAYKERVSTLAELAQELQVVSGVPKEYVEDDLNKWTSADTVHYLAKLIEQLAILDTFTEDTTKSIVKAQAQAFGVKLVKIAQPIRIALIGKSSGPGVFSLLAVLKKDKSVARLQALQELLQERYR